MGAFAFNPRLQRVEWPPGSGRVAFYSPHELSMMRELREQRERGEITRAELVAQVGFLHGLKAELGAVLQP